MYKLQQQVGPQQKKDKKLHVLSNLMKLTPYKILFDIGPVFQIEHAMHGKTMQITL